MPSADHDKTSQGKSAMGRVLTVVFAYGTLCVPAILSRVLGRKIDDLKFQDALLQVCDAGTWLTRRATHVTMSRARTTQALLMRMGSESWQDRKSSAIHADRAYTQFYECR